MADITPNSPNTIAVILATTLLAGVSVYMFGIFSSLGFVPIPFLPNNGPNYKPYVHSDTEEESEAEDIDADILDHAPNWGNGLVQDEKDGLRFRGAGGKEKGKENLKDVVVKGSQKKKEVEAAGGEECKLVLVVRTDLGMTKGMFSGFVNS